MRDSISGFQKAYDPSGLWRTLLFDGFPLSWVSHLAWLIVQAEIVIGLALLSGLASRVVTAVAIGLLLVFSGQLGFLLLFQEPPKCGCFGRWILFANPRHEALFGLVRNLVMAGLLVVRYRTIRSVWLAGETCQE